MERCLYSITHGIYIKENIELIICRWLYAFWKQWTEYRKLEFSLGRKHANRICSFTVNRIQQSLSNSIKHGPTRCRNYLTCCVQKCWMKLDRQSIGSHLHGSFYHFVFYYYLQTSFMLKFLNIAFSNQRKTFSSNEKVFYYHNKGGAAPIFNRIHNTYRSY